MDKDERLARMEELNDLIQAQKIFVENALVSLAGIALLVPNMLVIIGLFATLPRWITLVYLVVIVGGVVGLFWSRRKGIRLRFEYDNLLRNRRT